MIENFERDLAAALAYVYGNVADTAGDKIIAWRHNTLPQPTQEQCEDAVLNYQAYMTSIEYKTKRKDEYPPQADFLDAQVKINSGDPILVAEGKTQLADYYSACIAVKQKYPKP